MYLQWPLPRDTHTHAGVIIAELAASIQDWAEKHGVGYTQKLSRHGFRVSFDRDQDFTLFVMSWQPPDDDRWYQYEIKDPMRVDRYR